MKTLKLSVALMLLGTLAIADTVDEQITEIQNAAPQERVQLMNQLKKDLSTLGEEDRVQVMNKLRIKMQTDGEGVHELQTQSRERSRLNQMQETQNMQRAQNMQQHQTASQAMQQGLTSGGVANKFMGRK